MEEGRGGDEGNFESVAAVAYRGRDHQALNEVVRRIAFCLAVGNGDAHLKNWSLIYHDRRIPTLSPAYDLVSTTVYAPEGEPDDLGLRFGGTKRFEDLRLARFRRLGDRLNRRLGGVETDLVEIAAQTVELVRAQWPGFEHLLDDTPELRQGIGDWIRTRSVALLGSG